MNPWMNVYHPHDMDENMTIFYHKSLPHKVKSTFETTQWIWMMLQCLKMGLSISKNWILLKIKILTSTFHFLTLKVPSISKSLWHNDNLISSRSYYAFNFPQSITPIVYNLPYQVSHQKTMWFLDMMNFQYSSWSFEGPSRVTWLWCFSCHHVRVASWNPGVIF